MANVSRRCPKLRTLRERLAGQQLVNVHVMLTTDALGNLKRIAERENVPVAALIRRAISRFVHDQGG